MTMTEALTGLHPVLVELTVAPTLNFAMEQCGVPLVSAVRVQNLAAEPLVGARLSVRLSPDLGDATILVVDTVLGGESAYFASVDIRLPPGRLRAVVEAERAQLAWELGVGETVVATGHQNVELLAFNEWPGLRAPPALLASFVMPNHPVVAQLLRQTRDRLAKATGDNALSGYQSRSPKRVLESVQALVGAFQDLGISYIGLPASFEAVGQKVRLPDMVLSDGMGNCLDISLLLAGCLEQMGLAPLLVLVRGHAFPAVWLVDDRFPEGVVNDAARLRTLSKLGQILPFDSSTCVHASRPELGVAVAIASKRLEDDAAFECAVDVRVVRMDRFRPLPLRMTVAVDEKPADTPVSAAYALLAAASAEPAPAQPPAAAPPEPVVARFKRWKDRLLDLSLHNRLLNFRPGAKASLSMLVPDLGRFEDLLSADSSFEILPRADQDARDGRQSDLVKTRSDEDELLILRRAELEKRRIFTPCGQEELISRAAELERAARVDREEGGANTLFAAMGILKWFESSTAELPRYAPLLLVPVRLDYDRVARRVRVRRVEEETIGNVTLAEKMRRDFSVDLSAITTLEADESGVNVPALLRAARTAVQQVPRWEVLDEVHLGLFTFTKFLMWRDLETNAEALLHNEVVRHIAQGGATPFVDTVGEPPISRLDDDLPAGTIPAVLDCDSTQLAAVSAAMRGRSFVLQGPPGTGKSQTITNLIAAAVAEGKTVLFVSEKMAALDVVYRRLRDTGLGDYCLELHSSKANKKAVVTSLGQAMDRTSLVADPSWDARSAELGGVRTQLNAYVRALHVQNPLGLSFYQATGKLLGLRDAPDVRISISDVAQLTDARWREWMLAVDALADAGAVVEPVANHPWRNSVASEWSAAGEERAKDAVEDALAAIDASNSALSALATAVGVSVATGGPLDVELIALGTAIGAGNVPASTFQEGWVADSARAEAWIVAERADRATRADLATRWSERLDTFDVEAQLRTFQSWTNAFFVLAFLCLLFPRQALAAAAKGRLPDNPRIIEDLAAKAQLRRTGADRVAEQAWAAKAFAGTWDGNEPDDLERALSRAEALRAAVSRWRAAGGDNPQQMMVAVDPAAPPTRRSGIAAAAARAAEKHGRAVAALAEAERQLAAPIPGKAELLAYQAGFSSFRGWCFYNRASAAVAALALQPLAEAHRAGRLTAAQLKKTTQRAILSRWVSAARDAEPALRSFDGTEQRRRVAHFREVDRTHLKLGRERVLARLDARRPATAGGVAESSEPGILAREVKKQRSHLPVRKLLQAIPNLLPKLKPCLLMSPLSIAQYLPAGGRRFDLVVFDEASQIGTHDAIGAIARGNQVVIVGDSRQLPPTSFFSRDITDDGGVADENDIVEMESILDEALAARLPQQMLGWHYRSRHEALIEFSNQHYYDGRLNVFPAARGQVDELGVRWHSVPDGIYDKGKTRTNRREAEALVAWLVAELRVTPPGKRSFGIVTFSVAQQSLIEDLLDKRRGAYPEIEPHFSESAFEPVFIKNLENVQGDERDVILFSICYGPDEAGKVWMHFGPLNRTGGERRLNVAITRARRSLRVFSTLKADQIDVARTNAVGARHLKAFLQYAAERGSATGRVTRASSFESEFERQVHDALVAAGFAVDGQIGCGGYRVDLAVVHPNRPGEYVLGVECDGLTYHSGATARDRDRLREDVLEGLGWRLHRVWSTDWWFDREKRTVALIEAVHAAVAASNEPVQAVATAALVPDAVRAGLAPASAELSGIKLNSASPAAVVAPSPTGPPTIPYVKATLSEVSIDGEAMYAAFATAEIHRLIRELTDIEAPILIDEVCRRVAACWSITRLTDRLRRRVVPEVEALAKGEGLAIHGDFVWPMGAPPSAWNTIRGPSHDGTLRDAELIPPEEVAVAAAWVLSRSLSLDEATLSRETAKIFGISRVGRKVDERMRAGIDVLCGQKKGRRDEGRLVWVGN